jgi:hypothetical protein
MDKLLSLVTPWMMMKFVRWRMVRHVFSVVQATNVVRPGVPSSPAGSMRTILIAPKRSGKSAEEPLLIKIALVIVEFPGCLTADVVIA